MSSEADGRSTYNWTTLRYLVDPQREITVPMGVILWSEKEQRLWFRLPQEGERVPPPSGCDGVPAAQARTYLEMTRAKADGRPTRVSRRSWGRVVAFDILLARRSSIRQ